MVGTSNGLPENLLCDYHDGFSNQINVIAIYRIEYLQTYDVNVNTGELINTSWFDVIPQNVLEVSLNVPPTIKEKQKL